MAINSQDRAYLRQLYGQLSDRALKPGSPFYEPIYDTPDGDDPVALIFTQIDFSGTESIQLFSGFRGTGKTTELFRLQGQLEAEPNYFVIYADALNYINPSEPVDISTLLIILAGAFGDQIRAQIGDEIVKESFWTRFTNFLKKTEITPTEIGLEADLDSPAKDIVGGLKAGIDLKFELKSGSTFRQKLQKFMATRLKALKDEVDAFFEDGVAAIRREHGADTRIVFIFDQLEQIRGTLEGEEDVIRSVERVFAIHIDLLKMPYIHAVYTVPPWLKFRVSLPKGVLMTLLPTVHLWRNDAVRSKDEASLTCFRALVRRRLGDDGLARLFGAQPDAEHPLVDRIVEMSGGHFRDLLRLLQDTVIRAASAPGLPVAAALVENVINAARSQFLPIAQDDAIWLAEIARIRATALPSTDAGPVNRLSRFIDNHSVLYFVNAGEWYDVHPLIREEIVEVVQATLEKPH